MKTAQEILAANLKRLRKERGFTQSSLAEAVEIAPRSYQKYEQAETFPDDQNLDKLAKVFGVAVADLFRVHDSKQAPAHPGQSADYSAAIELLSKLQGLPELYRRVVLAIIYKDPALVRGATGDRLEKPIQSLLKAL